MIKQPLNKIRFTPTPLQKAATVKVWGFTLIIALVFLIGYLLQVNLAVPALLVSLITYFKFRNFNAKTVRPLYIVFLFALSFGTSFFFIKNAYPLYIPFSAIAMLATILFANLEISLVLTLALGISVASISGRNSAEIAALFLISGILSSIFVLGARKRTVIIRAGIITGIAQALTALLINRFSYAFDAKYVILILNGIATSIIVLGILPVFEYLFKTVTNISLLELADFNHPLLQRMILEAPGTYHHSLVVGNLSDAACSSIGSNGLLARVGAYYHDIGKLEKAEYFSENQKESKHDELAPTMSKLVIINHVKDGVELARKYKLNPRLIDFIIQHHGNSLVYYFYRRALENLEEDQEIKEEGFRYPGPKPDTKEAAVVLLADSVEAAARALDGPSSAKIAEMTHKIINNKFIDGQLDECDLALKDLEKISVIFIRMLGGIYHSRITYPEQKKKW